MNVANETEIATKFSSPWMQKAVGKIVIVEISWMTHLFTSQIAAVVFTYLQTPTVSQQLHYTRRVGHDPINVPTSMCKAVRRAVLYPVKKMLIQQGQKNMTVTVHNESTTSAENTNRLKSCQERNPEKSQGFQASVIEVRRLCPTYLNEPLTLSRPNGTAFNLQCPNGTRSRTPLLCSSNGESLPTAIFPTVSTSVPSVIPNTTTATSSNSNFNMTNLPTKQTMYQNNLSSNTFVGTTKVPFRGMCQSKPMLVQHPCEGTSALCHSFQSAPKIQQTARGYNPNCVQMYHEADLSGCGQKTYSGIPLTPPMSVTGHLSPNDPCCDISNVTVKQEAPPWGILQYPYPPTVTPPADKCVKQENDIDYSLLDEFFVRTKKENDDCNYF
ncbi:hypothetical protein DICVIV_09870 [Dictyocaulus viviparus]|uniref:Uncharacterized protein n=1 Tax=Dictyocaulus viviparus TaxID=29172 RepID=A0A0D8XHF6_DICVI|nr:hypothetical protein DICVIV_09870 [Dictyocaulus viviparus]